MAGNRELLQKKNRIVVKVGSSTLTHETGKLNYHRIERLAMEIADLANQGKEMVLVSSGAVSAGMGPLGLSARPKTIREKQAVAAVGQGVLMHTYEKMFREYGQNVGQVLLTRMDAQDRKKFMNSRNTLLTMLQMGVIPIINENDVVAIDEFKIGDNDTLSAMVSNFIEADLLIILSDVDGLYTANPQTHPEARIIPVVTEVDKHVYDIAGGAGSSIGTGGMYTKIQAASIATSSGVDMVIASGSEDGVLRRICQGEDVGTWFTAKDSNLHTKKRWLLSGGKARGSLIVDGGCRNALVEHGSSLLPVGIAAVEGEFHEGDIVNVMYEGLVIAKGIVNYNSESVEAIKRHKTDDIEKILGHEGVYEEVIHRDNLVVMQ
ncbi:glutamate 5-kinase [Megasphaera butyrica]|uniref:glutamate 5-kinase n=1 Tax=Megasphaera butyrica TaxID=2981791 RepID=UPI00082111F1|nr:glutamate 5-kinase [Megasphaera butyrica]MCU6714640.1 glutamate 5-kinase [Megasphaera butyrica]SCH67723.1 Glutamate 5-kinase [uncultured Megasphaera sp.]SCJ17115.1 Glutamate 5-kinase [uncultured Ruminococcus sp.]